MLSGSTNKFQSMSSLLITQLYNKISVLKYILEFFYSLFPSGNICGDGLPKVPGYSYQKEHKE